MKTRNLMRWFTLALVATVLTVAGYWGSRVLQTAFPEQGMLITAQRGTKMRVEADNLVVESGSANVASFSAGVRPLITTVYLLAATLSLVGVWSLFGWKCSSRKNA